MKRYTQASQGRKPRGSRTIGIKILLFLPCTVPFGHGIMRKINPHVTAVRFCNFQPHKILSCKNTGIIQSTRHRKEPSGPLHLKQSRNCSRELHSHIDGCLRKHYWHCFSKSITGDFHLAKSSIEKLHWIRTLSFNIGGGKGVEGCVGGSGRRKEKYSTIKLLKKQYQKRCEAKECVCGFLMP